MKSSTSTHTQQNEKEEEDNRYTTLTVALLLKFNEFFPIENRNSCFYLTKFVKHGRVSTQFASAVSSDEC